MGVLSWLTGCGSGGVDWSGVVIDLKDFKCGSTRVGEPVNPKDAFHGQLRRKEMLADQKQGIEVGTEDGILDYVFISLDRFPGSFAVAGRPLSINTKTCESDIVAEFGAPYWRDEDDDEVLLFFEGGAVELQFEFPGKTFLAQVTLLLPPLLADPEQRKAYGVDKPWPPNASTTDNENKSRPT